MAVEKKKLRSSARLRNLAAALAGRHSTPAAC